MAAPGFRGRASKGITFALALGGFLGLLVGCSATAPTGSPVDIHARIARVERARLASRDDGTRSRRTSNIRAAEAHRPVDRPAWRERVELADTGSDAPETTGPALKLSTDPNEPRLARAPLPSLWDTIKRDVKESPRELWRDTKRVYANPTNLVILGGAYAGSLALQETGPDNTVEDYYRGYDRTFNSDWSDAFGVMGNPATHFALAGGWYLLGQQSGDTKTYEVGKTLISALVINGVTVQLGQVASSDKAPNGEWGAFPSGHTSSSFVMASVLDHAYGHVVGIPLYGVATLAGVQRLDSGEHYLSDVVMGGVIGTLVGHSVASGRDPELFGWKILPYVNPESGASGVAFMKTK